MQDHDFEVLKVHASIAPNSADWPVGDVQVSIAGEKPKIKGELHWAALHGAVAEVRDRTLKALGSMAGVDDNKSLSPEGKREEKQKIAQAALDDMEKSSALAKARTSVEQQVARWNKELAPSTIDPTVAAEIRAHVSRLKEGDRLPFVTKHISDAAPAILQGPAFLSGFTANEIEIVRRAFEAKVNPDIADAKAKTMDALAHAEQGFRNAIRTIRDRAGVTVSGNGVAA